VKKVEIDKHKVCVNFFDLSGNKDYKTIRTEFYQDTSGMIMCYDVDNRDSFTSLVHWEDEMKRYGVDMARVKVVVCANKCDLKGREVNPKDAQNWCRQRGYTHYETSANTGHQVSEALEYLFK
jgi:DnaJ family protein C protein 27